VNGRLTLLTAQRVLRQLRNDPRTVALLVLVPCVLIGLLAWIYQGTRVFDASAPPCSGSSPSW
jgi:ABC-2 type transport system permease protein